MNELRRSASVLLALSLSAAACGDADTAKSPAKTKDGVSVTTNADRTQPYRVGSYDLAVPDSAPAAVLDDRYDLQGVFPEDADTLRLLALADAAAQGHSADLFAYPWDDTADRYDFKQTWYDSEAIVPMFGATPGADDFDEI